MCLTCQVCCFGMPNSEVYHAYCDPGLICNTTAADIRQPTDNGIGSTVALEAAYPTCIPCAAAEGSDPGQKVKITATCSVGFDNTDIYGGDSSQGLADPSLKIRPQQKLSA